MKTHKPVPVRAATWYRTSLALGLATLTLIGLLQSCGGQTGSSGPSGSSTPTTDEIKRNSILANTDTGPTKLQGLYKGNLINTTDEFLILVVPDTGNNVLAYAWYRKAAQPLVAHLYQGPLTLGTQGAASSASAWTISEGTNNYPGTATITGGSPSAMIADISITRSNVVAKSQMMVSALLSSEYVFNDAPTGLSGTSWNGTWSDRGETSGTAPGSTLLFGASGVVNATQSTTIARCVFSQGAGNSLTWAIHTSYPGKNIFEVTLTLGSITSCDWQNKTLSGIAVVSQKGAGYQLDMMLLDGTGAGISYRGTR